MVSNRVLELSGVTVSVANVIPYKDRADVKLYVVNGIVPKIIKLDIEALDEHKDTIMSKYVEAYLMPLEKRDIKVSVPLETKYIRVTVMGLFRELLSKEIPISIPRPKQPPATPPRPVPPAPKPPSIPPSKPPSRRPSKPKPTTPPKKSVKEIKDYIRENLCGLIDVKTRMQKNKMYIDINARYPYKISDVLHVDVIDEGIKDVIMTEWISINPSEDKSESTGRGVITLDIYKIVGNIKLLVKSTLVDKTCIYNIPKPKIPIKKPPSKKPVAEYGFIRIRVIDSVGKLIPANIDVIGNNYYKELKNVSEIILKVPPGNYTVRAWREGYKTSTSNTMVSKNSTSEVTLLLAKIPPSEKPKPIESTITVRPFYTARERIGMLSTAKVYIDNKYVGTGMVTVKVIAGTHTIRVEHPDYETAVKQVTVNPGETKIIDIIMKPKTKTPPSKRPPSKKPPTTKPQLATINIYNVISAGTRIVPVKANVYVNGRYIGTGDMLTIRVAPGTYNIESDTGEYYGRATVSVKSGDKKDVYIVMKPKTKKAKPPSGGGEYPIPPSRPRPLPM